MIWKLSCTHQDGWTQHIFTVYQATTKMRMDHYWFSLAVGKAGGPGKASNQTLWLRHRYCNWVFMHMDVPERCHRLTAISSEKQHDADTQTRVSFSLHIWRIWTEKKKKARLFHGRGRWENARVGQQIYTYCTLFSARLGSVKRPRHLLWIGNNPEPAATISQEFTVSSDKGIQIHSEGNLVCRCFFFMFFF